MGRNVRVLNPQLVSVGIVVEKGVYHAHIIYIYKSLYIHIIVYIYICIYIKIILYIIFAHGGQSPNPEFLKKTPR